MEISNGTFCNVLLLLVILLSWGKVSGSDDCTLQTNSTVRLNNTAPTFSMVEGVGRLEICFCIDNSTCSWQTVSTGSLTTPFSWKNSIVVCRELGHFDVQSPILQNTVPVADRPPASVPIFGRTFNCDGSESSLLNCASSVSAVGLTHASDAYLMCQTGGSISNKVRLVGSTAPNAGIVEVYYSRLSRWVTICPSSWSATAANVACISLGYASGTTVTYDTSLLSGTEVNTNPDISVMCLGNTPFSQCTFTQLASCNNGNGLILAGVTCTPTAGISEGSVREYNSSLSNSFNRVEVFYNGRWGTVCDNRWDMEDGQVLCRELGRGFEAIPASIETFNPLSSRPIYVLAYNCIGTESNLTTCRSPSYPVGFVTSDCSHGNDAGVRCESSGGGGGDGGSSSVGGAITGVIFFIIFAVFALVIICMWFRDTKPVECFCDGLSCFWDAICSCVGSICDTLGACKDRVTECDCDCISGIERGNVGAVRHSPPPLAEPICLQPRRRSSSLSLSSTSSSSSGDSISDDSGSSTSSSSSRVVRANQGSSSRNTEVPESKSEFTKNAPPAYNDALRLKHVEPPPEYKEPTEQVQEQVLPYPVLSEFDPAHPPELPSNTEYQGYPPPTIIPNPDIPPINEVDPAVDVGNTSPPYPTESVDVGNTSPPYPTD